MLTCEHLVVKVPLLHPDSRKNAITTYIVGKEAITTYIVGKEATAYDCASFRQEFLEL